MENVKYTIYKLIDPISNEIRYIGLTFNDLNQRLKSHCSEKSKSHKSNWIQQLKSKGLKPIIESIEDNILSYDAVCYREIYWIEKYKSEGHPLTNMASGGNKNKKMSDETRKKMSDSAKNRNFKLVLSDETKILISERTKKRFESEHEREKLRISNKRYEDSKTEEQKINDILIQNPKKVYQYDKDMNLISNYPSIKNAERTTGISSSNIAKCCKHKVTFVSGYVWRFEGDLTPPKYKNRKEVLKYDIDMNLLEKYENIRKASLDTKVSDSGIRLCCNNKRYSAGGFIWKYK
jgi:group I intron endonuclease